MISGPAFFEKFAGTWVLDKRDNNSTKVTFKYGYKSKWFMIPAIFDRLISIQFGWDTKRRLNALKEFCEAEYLEINYPPGRGNNELRKNSNSQL